MAEMQEKCLIERKNGKKNGEWQVNDIIFQFKYATINFIFCQEKNVDKI